MGVAGFARKFSTPVYLTPGTCQAKVMGLLPELHRIDCHSSFMVGTFEVTPVAVPHDAREPLPVCARFRRCHRGVCWTDLGHITPHVKRSYRDCDALLLECNHDPVMLEQGPYPYPLKRRVGGDYGHLNNDQAAELLNALDLSRLQHLVLSHISAQNNLPDLARDAVMPPAFRLGGLSCRRHSGGRL